VYSGFYLGDLYFQGKGERELRRWYSPRHHKRKFKARYIT